MRNKFLWSLLVAVSIFAFTSPAYPQAAASAGSIYGRVQDDKGAPLPGVTTTLECDTLTRSQTAVTGPTGSFRFSQITPGMCSVTFSLEGFTEVRQEEVRVTIGGEVQLAITLRPTLQEEFVVVAETPVVDQRKTGNETTFSTEYLEQVPTGRDPWTIIEQTPGVDNDRINIAGSESGQQSGFFARGDNDANNGWRYDGISAEDPAALGGSTYYDFDSFEEVQIISGGADASIGKSGVQVNIVTKRGGNRWEANVSGYYVNEDLQSTNTPDELEAIGVERSNRIDQVYEYGFDIGGPIIKDSLFAWGAYRKNQIDLFTRTGLSDKTELKNLNFKMNANINSSNEIQGAYWDSGKEKQGRGFDIANQDAETLWNQGSPGNVFEPYVSVQHTWIPNDSTILTSRYGHIGISFALAPAGGADTPMIYMSAIPRWEDTAGDFFSDRVSHSVNADLNWFKENWAGGDHEFKFGFEWSNHDINSFYSYGNGIFIIDYYQTVRKGPLTTGYIAPTYFVDGFTKYNLFSTYASDTYRKDRLTLNLGLRFDWANGQNDPATIPGVTGFESLLGPINFTGNDGSPSLSSISPRLGATYDLTGDGKTILRGNYARYYSGYGPGFDTYSNPTFTTIGAGFIYVNSNGDRNITQDELVDGPFPFGGLTDDFQFNQAAFEAIKGYDSDLESTPIDEFIIGFEREVVKDLSIGANWTYRKYDGTISAIPTLGPGGRQLTTEDFVPQTPIVVNIPQGTFTIPYAVLGFTHDGSSILTNVEGYSQTYNGVDFVARKRMSNNFLVQSSLTLQRQEASYDNDGESFWIVTGDGLGAAFNVYGDPISVPDKQDGEPYAFASGGSGKTGVYPYPEWTFRVSGVYQWPWDISTGAFVRYVQGYPQPLFATITDSTLANFYGRSGRALLVSPIGTQRYDNIFTLDLNVRKTFEIGAAGRITASLDIFNITNSNDIVQVERRTTVSSFNTARGIQENLSPRAFRLGARYSF
jgi:hypothetical protein